MRFSAILYGEIDQFFARFLSLWYDRVDLKTRKNIRRLIELKCAATVKSAANHTAHEPQCLSQSRRLPW